ncbi:MAG: MFS transporter, partial [Anaerolineales bacterium]|nr:MFS transporter [Anaerolineales bacterium]
MDDPDLPVVDVRNPQMFPLYLRSSGYAASVGFAHPFTGVYALSLGATGGQLGLLTSISNLLMNLFQVPFGNLSDKFGQRKGFIIIGGVLASLLWFPMLFITEPWQLIVILAIQSIFGAMAAPAWLALIADIAPIDKRGELSAIINALASIGTLL